MTTTILDEAMERARQLPEDLQKEVADFVRFLDERRVHAKGRTLRLDWRGLLRDMRDQYTSVELQHKISEWR